MVEGADHPMEVDVEFSKRGKTMGLLLHLTKSTHHTGRYIVLGSGFCVLQALAEVKKCSVIAGELIKKHWYWPSLVPDETIDLYFSEKALSIIDSVEGTLDGVKHNIWCMKDSGYVAKIMGMVLGLFYPEERLHHCVLEDGQRVSLKYTESCYLHYKYRHLVDDKNIKCHAVPSIEESIKRQMWSMSFFQYV